MFKSKANLLFSISDGCIISLEEVKDDVFSKKMLGGGYGIIPVSEYIVSPIAGKISMIFPTKHAIGLTTKDGIEILIHVGIDTVKVNENIFELYVEVGDKVKVGTTLMKFNRKRLLELDYDITTLCIVTNSNGKEYDAIMTNNAVGGKTKVIDLLK